MSEMCKSLLTSRNVYTDEILSVEYTVTIACVQEWPVHGGEWGTANCNYPEIIVTGFVRLSVCLSVFLISVRCVLDVHFNSACALQNYIRLVYSAVPFVWLGGYAHCPLTGRLSISALYGKVR